MGPGVCSRTVGERGPISTQSNGPGTSTAVDADGTKAGYDITLTRTISEAVHIPVIASGGAGTLDHMVDVLRDGKADAVLAASIFHFGEYTVGDVKAFLAEHHVPIRPLFEP